MWNFGELFVIEFRPELFKGKWVQFIDDLFCLIIPACDLFFQESQFFSNGAFLNSVKIFRVYIYTDGIILLYPV